LVQLPTGSGKTVIFAHEIERFRRYGHRALVLAHRDELITQAIAKLRDVLGPEADIGIVKAESDEAGAQIVVASVQTLARDRRLQRLERDFGLVVVDEAHHAAAESYQRILEYLGCFKRDGPYTLGVTATVDRGDGVGLDRVFETIAYELGMVELMQQGYLVDLRALQIAVRADFNALHTRAGDFIDSETGNMLLAADAPTTIAKGYKEHAADRSGIVFTPNVAVAHAMAEAFQAERIPAAALDGTTPDLERRRILQDLNAGAVQVVANCAVLTEGFDEPRVSTIVIAKPTKSRILYTQMIGRGTRPSPGKTDCLIVDTVGATVRHDLQTVAELFGLPPSSVTTKTVAEAIAERQAAEIPTAVDGQIVAATVELFKQRPANWVPTRTGRFVLPTGDGMLVLKPGFGDRWDVVLVPRDGEPVVLAGNLSAQFAQGVAEDHARARGAHALINRDAPWRRRPPSDKQLYVLRCLRIPTKGIRTCGEASDAISAAKAAEVLR
jgi:superfamily II DNA or RNA helicase